MLLFQENCIPLHQIKIHSMKRVIPFLPWIGALLLIAFALIAYESDLLWKVQQYNLFLDTSLFFREQMLVPGGLLSYVSCYFTQFFFHPWLGVLILCGWWFLLMWLTKRTFRIPDNWAVLALVPVVILLVADMSLGYWHYFMKLRGYFFVPTIGTTIAVAMLWLFRIVSQKMWIRIVAIVVATVVGYPLMGAYGLVAVLLMGLWMWRLSDNRTHNAIVSFATLLCILAVPLFCYRFIYYQTNFCDLWTMALPAFVVLESYPVYYIPYYILGLFFLSMVFFYQKAMLTPLKPLYKWTLQAILGIVLIAVVWDYWYKDENFRHELVMQRCIELCDWEGVIREGQKQGDVEPTRAIVMMHNLALQRLGRQLDEMYSFPKGNAKSNTPLPFNMMYHVFGRMIYYQYGLLNDCHRMCMEDGVEYGWRVELQQFMVRCYLLSGENQAALRELNLLRHTLFHGRWADEMQQLLGRQEQMAKHKETGSITHMLHYKNGLGADNGFVEDYLMRVLSRQDSDDSYFQEQAVLGALWQRDPKAFWLRFAHYARLHPKSPMPRIFQEAAYLFGKMENRPGLDRMPFDKGVKKSYDSFMKELKKYENRSADIGRVALYPFFGNTYFYEYYFLKYSH